MREHESGGQLLQAMNYHPQEHYSALQPRPSGGSSGSIEADVVQRIMTGELVLTGYCVPVTLASRREVVPPELLDVLQIDFTSSEADGPGIKLVRLQVHVADGQVASWASSRSWHSRNSLAEKGMQEFTHSADYGRVTIRGIPFDLSGGLCRIVARLHKAAFSADPWLVGKQLMADCGYGFGSLADAFKRHRDPYWRELVEGNGRGLFRLNLQEP